jgi:amino acid transporter
VYLLFYPVVIAQVGSFMGSTLQSALKVEYNINFQWWWFMVFLILFVGYTSWRGVELSVRLLIVLGIIEALIVLALAVNGFASPGPGGVNLGWLSFSNAHGLFRCRVRHLRDHRWDAGPPLAEESRTCGTVPGAVMGSIVIMGVFLVLVSWGQTSGWGTDKLTAFAYCRSSPRSSGQRYWGGACG